ncbi:MAG: hypothetical protein PVJ86_10375 [Phycisphaerales bacterium]|jgi:hypothetical protein
MARTSGRILKSDDVKLEGQYHLEVGRAETATAEPQQRSAVLAAPQVSISENHPEYAVIEVTCSCGTKMCLRCEYAGAQAPENAQMQNGAIEASDQTE